MISRFRLVIFLCLPLALGACGSDAADQPISLDDELAEGANAVDPLLAAAVQDPIMSDPQLSTRSNVDAIRPPAQPYSASVPAIDIAPDADADDPGLMTTPAATQGPCRQCTIARDAITLGALAARQADPRLRACAPSLGYAAGWATRLPADLPLYAGARVIEAAGTDGTGCRIRAVSFATKRPAARMLDWHFTQATKAGYTTEHQADDAQHVLVGSRPRDGAAYIAFVRDAPGGGSEIDLLLNAGR